jgi:hypothetical protein
MAPARGLWSADRCRWDVSSLRSDGQPSQYDGTTEEAMDSISQIALAGGLAWASGIRLYATVLIVGLLGRYGYLHLPAQLLVLQHTWVLVAAAVMGVGEFLADKVPGFDSIWDALHTFIRIPAGAFLAWGAMGDATPAMQMTAALVGGAITSGTHLAKSGSRAAINTSPEPFTNWTASASEDGLVLGGLALALTHPAVFLVALGLFLLAVIWLVPKLFRFLAGIFQRLRGSPGNQPATRT